LTKLNRRHRTAVTGGDRTHNPTGGSIMARITDHVLGDHPQRARRDLTTSWEHLLNAAGHGAKHVGQSSRRRARIARDRAETARLALLGELPPSPWRWLGVGLATGLAAGLAVGAAGATVLARARRKGDQTATDEATATVSAAPSKIREKASAGAEAVRERTVAAVQRANTSARGAAIEFRDRLTLRDSTGEPEPADAVSPPPSVTVPGH
jgi:hypothetical protein